MRNIDDPRVLRAMAHPVRLKLANALAIHGPATATELAELLGDTPANCSWHLRQLAKFEFIEEATDLPAKGRNRPWRWIGRGNRWGNPGDPPELATAGAELTSTLLGVELAEHAAWEARRLTEPPEWQDAAFISQTIGWLTAEELAQVRDEINAVLRPHFERLFDPAKRPKDSRPIRFVAWGVPAR